MFTSIHELVRSLQDAGISAGLLISRPGYTKCYAAIAKGVTNERVRSAIHRLLVHKKYLNYRIRLLDADHKKLRVASKYRSSLPHIYL